jgi:hypothetical protein
VTVRVLGDAEIENNETVVATLSNPGAGVVLLNTNATVTILENDASFTITTNAFTVLENATNAVLRVVRSGSTNTSMTVDYLSVAGTATANTDYVGTNGTLTFAAGVRSNTIVVPLVNDSVVESSEAFSVIISNVTAGAVLGAFTNALVTITDNDCVVSIVTTNVTVSEGAGSTLVTVRRTGYIGGALTVGYGTTNGTAIAGSDYTAATGNLTFSAGSSNAPFTVRITSDASFESDEIFTAGLSMASTEGSLSNSLAIVTIRDNDFASGDVSTGTPKLQLSGVCKMANGSATVTITGPQGASFTVEVSTDLKTWTPLGEAMVTDQTVTILDEGATGDTPRFYRVVQPNNP